MVEREKGGGKEKLIYNGASEGIQPMAQRLAGWVAQSSPKWRQGDLDTHSR